MGIMMLRMVFHKPACASAWMPRVDRARLMERPALRRVRRISGRFSNICTLHPRFTNSRASRGPLSPAPITVMDLRLMNEQTFDGRQNLLGQKGSGFPQLGEEFLVEGQ